MNCKICGKELTNKIIRNKEICKECILAAKSLDRKKSRFTTKEIIKIIIILGALFLLAIMNICAAITNQTIPALIVTAFIALLGFAFLAMDI